MAEPILSIPSHLPRPLRMAVVTVAVAVLLWLSLAPTEDLPGEALLWDKAEHTIAYLVLMAVGLVFAPRRLRAFTAFAFGLGVAVELLQAAMGFGRHGDWRDLAANSLGIAVGAVIWALIVRRRAV